jgi:putative transposase
MDEQQREPSFSPEFTNQVQDQARFVCTGCGHEANADTNAAINILQRGLDKSLKPAEGHRVWRPEDAGSIRRAA